MQESQRKPPMQRATHPLLEVSDISKSFGRVTALENVSIHLNQGEVVGLVGENGAGKSTLLNILTGVLAHDSGSIALEGESVSLNDPLDASRKGISLVPQETEVISNLPAFENIFLNELEDYSTLWMVDSDSMRADAETLVDGLDIELDMQTKPEMYSVNEQKLLSIATAFNNSLDSSHPIIFLDEPTAGLSRSGRQSLFDQIRRLRDRATFVLVTHNIEDALEHTDRIYVMRDGKLVNEFESDNTTTDEIEQSMVGAEVSETFYHTAQQVSASELTDAREALTVEEMGYKEEIPPLSFSVRAGEILGVAGLEGSKKEELGRLLIGNIQPTEGEIYVDGEEMTPRSPAQMVDAGLGYVPKHRKTEGVMAGQSVVVNTSIAVVRELAGYLPVVNFDAEREITTDLVDRLEVKTPSIKTPIDQLSGGNQQKVVLARWLAKEVSVLVLDNPTQGIDVGAKEELYELFRELCRQGVAIVFIADELHELIGLSNRIMVMNNGEVADMIDASTSAKPTEDVIINKMV